MDSTGNNLSSYKKEILKQFRFDLLDHLTPDHTDAVLLKWLRARNFDLKKAEQNFRENEESRKTYGINTITETHVKPKVVQKYERTWFLGFAKDGSPVRYASFHADLNGFIHSVSSYDLCLYFFQNLENDIKIMKEQNRKTGQNHSEIIYVLDFDGFSFQDFYYKCVLEVGFDITVLLQNHFPEIWKYIFFVNAPYILDKVLTLLKPVMRNSFLEKLKIVPRSSTSQLLRKYIDDSVLPTFLGGSREDSKGDPRCGEFINDYSKIPEEYYLKNTMHFIDETDPGVSVVTVGARRVFNVPLVLKKKGKIKLEMRTENGSIYFSILYRDNAENPELPESGEYLDPNDEASNVRVVGSRIRFQSHISPCDGTYTASWPGVYILQFDNTTSWVGSRKLYYRVTSSPDL